MPRQTLVEWDVLMAARCYFRILKKVFESWVEGDEKGKKEERST
jgi:hypothetical protein